SRVAACDAPALAEVVTGVAARDAPPVRTSAAPRAIERRRMLVVIIVTSPWQEALRGPWIGGVGRPPRATGAAHRTPSRAAGPLRSASRHLERAAHRPPTVLCRPIDLPLAPTRRRRPAAAGRSEP